MGIPENERAEELAKEGQTAPRDMYAEPILAGVKAVMRSRLHRHREDKWRSTQASLSRRYREWDLQHEIRYPPELQTLSQPQLHRLLALRTRHGDFAWYHRKLRHDDAELDCSCGDAKTPKHLVHCRKALTRFDK